MIIIKRVIGIICILLLLVGCGGELSDEEKGKEEKTDMIASMHNDYGVMGTDALSVLWNIEDDVTGKGEYSETTLFHFTDEYLLNEDRFNKMSDAEQNVVMHTSGMVSKFNRGVYEDEEKLEEDKEKLLGLMKHGINE